MPDVRCYKIERLKAVAGERHEDQRFFIRPGSRKGRWKFFDGPQVPRFDGDVAWFEIERDRGRWTFLRQVPPPV